LYLRVRLGRHPDFRVRDRDLFTELTVAPWEAVLGGTVTVPTLEGDVHLRIPAGSRAGQQLRLRGRGLPAPEGERGDLYVALGVDVPASVTAEERALWEKLAATSRYRPRREA
jgi:curved DNA-binding protein